MNDTQTGTDRTARPSRAVRDLADDHVRRLTELDPILAGELGCTARQDELPDLSPDGTAALVAVCRETLDRLDTTTGAREPADPDERRCARLLGERLGAQLDHLTSGEPLRAVQELFGPLATLRTAFTLMPVDGDEDWATVAARMPRVPEALAGYRASLAEGCRRGLFAAPRQVVRVTEQIDAWNRDAGGRGWFAAFAADASVGDAVRADLDRGAQEATTALGELRDWLATEYLPAAAGTPDGVGPDRYRIANRFWNGADIDTTEAYEWGWSEFHRIRAEMAVEAERIVPGGSVREAMELLETDGGTTGVVVGGEAARAHLQKIMDETIAELDGVHFDLSGRLREVESRLAPAGSATAPYYTPPALDFSRPGRTWLPENEDDRYPLWDLISTWYHEGVPGHHLQLASWAVRSRELSTFQTSLVGAVSADVEGWALYAELLMDELGHHADPGSRLGYLNAQMLRAVRVVIDLGMHLSLPIPDDSPVGPGLRWTPELRREFFGRHVGGGDAMADSELLRYLGGPAQAIGYKLGERAWLTGRERARAAHAARGEEFDLAAWHAAALAQGTLGLDDLVPELAALPAARA
ncbi:DUF885 domain-containing protein [Pseudonocardia sp. EV170527-09]|uniref:DUF885 domain-containing protein n=1 Tax=Pseudonocardia sp. EV170527-09 TaxID=2603411 RepID=UPI0011F1E61D|nr:DUF885 domain-containing protein [Pseudonocardia sp. EV170527-09]KAA1034970.1 DUF885 domain-containing protein [Pseudonocardia sp. EV170527-09]